MVEKRIVVAPAKPASTVVILRDGPVGLEVFMVKRAASMAFGANAFVFPGGKVDEADQALGADDSLGFYRCAALREAFEECGFLLAEKEGRALSADALKSLTFYRAKLVDGEIGFNAFLQNEGLKVQPDRLIYIGRWITPDHFPRRFDARFFAVVVPDGQHLQHDGYEAVHSEWVQPEALLARADKGEVYLMPPTFHVLTDLAKCKNAQNALHSLAVLDAEPDKREAKLAHQVNNLLK